MTRSLGSFLALLGRVLTHFVRAAGALALVFARSARQLPKMDGRELARGLVILGYASLPLAITVGFVTGATVVLQTTLYVQRFGARGHIGWAAGYAVLWEFGPLLLGLMMAARVGARNAAELASLTIGGQLEGLRGISLDPFALLIAPRIVATTLCATCLSTVAFLVAILGEAAAAYATLRLPLRAFIANFAESLSALDLLGGIGKSLLIGLAIALISTVAGLRASRGAADVGRAAASSVVWSSAAVFGLDFLVTSLMAPLIRALQS